MNKLQLLQQHITSQKKYQKILVQNKDKMATIWLNSPKDLNALSIDMSRQIKQALIQLNHDNTVKIITIRSKSQKIFCAGGDIKGFVKYDFTQYPHNQHFYSVAMAIKAIRKPIVSIVQGIAFGGGFQLALLTDVIVCSSKAVFGLPEITLGLIPGMGGTQILTKIVGEKVAKRLIFTGQKINAEEAHRLNIAYLISQKFQQKTNQFLNSLVNKASHALFAAKKAVWAAEQTNLDEGMRHQSSIFRTLFPTKGAKEGINAFIEKRKPNFKDL